MKLSNRSTLLAGALAALIAVCALSGAGCAVLDPQADAVSKVGQLEQSYSLTMRVLLLARLKGLIDDDAYDQIEQARAVASAALDSLKADAAAGKPVDKSAALRAFNRALDELILRAQPYQGQVRLDGPGDDLGSPPSRTDLGLYLGRGPATFPARPERRAA